jgi:membrane protease YdiL (CAAX protease family)
MRHATGLRWGAPGSLWGLYWLFGLVGVSALTIAAPFTGALLGLYALDLEHFSGFRAYLEAIGRPAPQGQIMPLVLVAVVSLPLQTLLIAPWAFGEEWGWRGYLLPRLLPLGQWRALLASGVIWGLWHAPIILLGANYPGHPILGILAMIGLNTIIGILLNWTRLATGSVWPAVLGHAALDISIPVSYVWSRAGATYDPLHVTITGWTGWILPLLVIAFLVITHRLPVRNAPDLAPRAVLERMPSAVTGQAQA